MDKQHILEEIKRTAKANGGKPLGKERFYRETGINESDWIGKHWARWGDAVRESGLEPNQMQGSRDEHELIEKFIELARELRKFPTANEVKLKARTAVGFPWHNSFARFGSKQQFASRIQEYCKEREGYADIIAICAPIAETRRTTQSDKEAKSEESFGFLFT